MITVRSVMETFVGLVILCNTVTFDKFFKKVYRSILTGDSEHFSTSPLLNTWFTLKQPEGKFKEEQNVIWYSTWKVKNAIGFQEHWWVMFQKKPSPTSFTKQDKILKTPVIWGTSNKKEAICSIHMQVFTVRVYIIFWIIR